MSTVDTTVVAAPPAATQRVRFRVNWKLSIGVLLMFGPLVVGLAAPLLLSSRGMQLGTYLPSRSPSAANPLGTDTVGRDVLTMLLYSIPTTIEIGIIAGAVGTGIGTAVGLISGYYRGWIDSLVRGAADVMLGIPILAVLVVIAALIGATSITTMALIIAIFSWPFPARAIRAQVLSLRELPYIQMSKLSGRNDLQIMFLEILPNLLAYIAAGMVGAVSGAVLAVVGLELLGLGQVNTPTLGLMLQNSFSTGALLQGLWWWWLPPTIVLVLLFIGLFLMSMALDEIANPRLRSAGS